MHWEKKTFTVGAVLSIWWPFSAHTITKVVHIINKLHHFSKLYSIYRHNNNMNGFLMHVLVGIEVLHMNEAEKVLKF